MPDYKKEQDELDGALHKSSPLEESGVEWSRVKPSKPHFLEG